MSVWWFTGRHCVRWGQGLSDPMALMSESLGNLLSFGCLAGLRKNVGRPFQSKRDLMLCFEIIYFRKSLALKKPQDKFSDSTVIMQIEMYC